MTQLTLIRTKPAPDWVRKPTNGHYDVEILVTENRITVIKKLQKEGWRLIKYDTLQKDDEIAELSMVCTTSLEDVSSLITSSLPPPIVPHHSS